MTQRDPLIIGTVSVIIIVFTFSLLNIYVFPNLFFKVDISRNTDNEIQLNILNKVEDIGLNSTMWDGLNITRLIVDDPEYSISNITWMIFRTINKKSGVYDYYPNRPNRITFTYNGTIVGASNDSEVYLKWINSIFGATFAGNYFAYFNSTSDYVAHSNLENSELPSYTRADMEGNLTEILNDSLREPIFAIYQTVDYYESRSILSTYSLTFSRLVLVNEFGDIIFFLSNEGSWLTPLI